MALMNSSQLAVLLSTRKKQVTTRQVGMWHARRAKNGFPAPVGMRETQYGRFTDKHIRSNDLWDSDAVVSWYANYDSKPGPKPRAPTEHEG